MAASSSQSPRPSRSIDDSIRMLNKFRVYELKTLLRDLGLSTNGRKRDLYVRAVQELNTQNSKIEDHITTLYCKNFGRPIRSKSPLRSPVKSSPTKVALNSTNIVRPDVRFKSLPFYQVLDSIIKPTSLASNGSYRSGHNCMWLNFHLSPQQLQLISSSKSSKGDSQVQVILRFCKQESSCEQDDYFPVQCFVHVNHNPCPLPNYYPQLSLRSDYKRTGRPVDITPCVYPSPTQLNMISITWGIEYIVLTRYCVCVDLVQVKSPNDLLQSLKSSRVRSPDVCRALVREKLSVDKDSEISATSLRVSLVCPLGKMRMQHPCRSLSCMHLQCFDAKTYLQMNEKNSRWICPVCDKPAPLNDIVIDGLLMEICEKSTHTDIEFSADGSWHPFVRDTGFKLNISDYGTPSKSDVVTIGDSSPRPGGSVVIDLTVDSDEEVLEPQHMTQRTRPDRQIDASHCARLPVITTAFTSSPSPPPSPSHRCTHQQYHTQSYQMQDLVSEALFSHDLDSSSSSSF